MSDFQPEKGKHVVPDFLDCGTTTSVFIDPAASEFYVRATCEAMIAGLAQWGELECVPRLCAGHPRGPARTRLVDCALSCQVAGEMQASNIHSRRLPFLRDTQPLSAATLKSRAAPMRPISTERAA